MLFLGETLYQQLEQQHFLDVFSVRYPDEQRVYGLRRDRYQGARKKSAGFLSDLFTLQQTHSQSQCKLLS